MKITKIFILILLLSLVGCENKEEKAAKEMLGHANQLFEQQAFDESLMLLDSLQKAFPRELKVRQDALELVRSVRLEQSRQDSIRLTPMIAQSSLLADSLYKSFTLIEAPNMPDENVIRYKGYNPSSSPAAPFLDCYLMSDGEFVVVAGVSGSRKIGATSIQLTEHKGNTYIYSDTIPYDGGLNYRYDNLGRHFERLTFKNDKAAHIASFIANAPKDATISIVFGLENGKQGQRFSLNKRAQEAISESYRYYAMLQEIKEMHEILERHQRRLQLQTEREQKKAITAQ